ncbi:MAG: mechanosensitive ion channel family protein [Terriglobia bacterium]
MPEGITLKGLLPTVIAVVGVLALLWVGLWLSSRAIRRLAEQMGEKDKEHIKEVERWAKQLIRFVRLTVGIVFVIAAVFIVLQTLGIRGLPALTWKQVAGWLVGSGLRILLVLGGAFVLTRVLHLLIARLPLFVVPRTGPLAQVAEQQKRATTITRLLRMISTVVVMSIAVLIVLRELGVDITPILTGAGIAGLAFGFGAQHLVRDIISGFFLIVEDQVRVGDVAIINGKGGLVEAIRLRTIVLRGLDGTVHIFPNGAISELSNMTKDFSYYVIDLGVAYKENVDRVMEVLKEVGAELQADPEYADKILAPLEILGVDAFADSAVVIKARIKTAPIQQWTVGRELRRRIKHAFDARGIEIPFPHLSIYFGEASKPFAVQVAEQLARRESAPAARSRGSS